MMRTTRVCVIGAGASGLVMTKELLESGHQPLCVDAASRIGGVFARSYDNTNMTSSSHMTAFSDFPPKCAPTMWSAEEYLEYLQEYANAFNVIQHVRLNTKVSSVQRLDQASAGAYWVVVLDTANGVESHYFDYVVISTGTHSIPKRFKYEGQDEFEGQVIHSGDITNWDRFDNSNVVCVGMGESGADICLEVAKRPGTKVALSIRSSPGWIVPRYRGIIPADMMTNRLLWGLPRRLGGIVGGILARADASYVSDPVVRKMGIINLQSKNTDFGLFGTFGTKSTSGVEAIVLYGAEEKPDVARLGPGRLVTFTDGSQFEADYVIQSTGFRPCFKYLQPEILEEGAIKDDQLMSEVVSNLSNVRQGLYKHAIHPKLGLRLMFQGFVRPGFGALPPLSEMQARWYVSMLTGTARIPLPPSAEMISATAADAQGEEFMFRKGAGLRNGALVDFVVYLNDLASLIGCQPPFSKLLVSDPVSLWKVFTGPHSGAQFRLAGPGAKTELARQTLLSYPSVFFPLKKLAVISAALWLGSTALYICLLPFPRTWFGGLRDDMCPVGFGNSREVFNHLARLRTCWDIRWPVHDYSSGAVPAPAAISKTSDQSVTTSVAG